MEVIVSVPDPLLTKDEYDNSSTLSIRVFSVHSIPENWYPKKEEEANIFTYNVAIKGLPHSAPAGEHGQQDTNDPTLIPQSSQVILPLIDTLTFI